MEQALNSQLAQGKGRSRFRTLYSISLKTSIIFSWMFLPLYILFSVKTEQYFCSILGQRCRCTSVMGRRISAYICINKQWPSKLHLQSLMQIPVAKCPLEGYELCKPPTTFQRGKASCQSSPQHDWIQKHRKCNHSLARTVSICRGLLKCSNTGESGTVGMNLGLGSATYFYTQVTKIHSLQLGGDESSPYLKVLLN